ncbi:hypothetical protein WAF17_10060 [Bernardetia sp. ABR2-2B]|uniref:hypothetical protein n=1 Tax=Bernardetia sp. ABR2-2B TaxID=3127472 RepID=UPI0030D60EF6
MNKEIISRIRELGGTTKSASSLQEFLQGIEFNHPLYPKENWGNELYGVDDFYDDNKKLYKQNKDKFYERLMEHFFSDHEIPCGQMFYRKRLFTPLTKGTTDFEEWGDDFEDEEMTNLSEVKKVVGSGSLEFMEIAYSYGFPDGYYICLSDPNPQNPTVFGTDHEVFFEEITNEGAFEEFLKRFYAPSEFLEVVKDYIEEEKR